MTEAAWEEHGVVIRMEPLKSNNHVCLQESPFFQSTVVSMCQKNCDFLAPSIERSSRLLPPAPKL